MQVVFEIQETFYKKEAKEHFRSFSAIYHLNMNLEYVTTSGEGSLSSPFKAYKG